MNRHGPQKECFEIWTDEVDIYDQHLGGNGLYDFGLEARQRDYHLHESSCSRFEQQQLPERESDAAN